jgi:hypothetical protein
MRQTTILFAFFLCFLGNTYSQSKLNFEFQAYPTGLIPGLRYEHSLNENSSALIRLGYNWIRHRDLGVHDDERGDGFGFTLGYTHHISKFDLSLKSDLWWNSINWKDNISMPNELTGNSKITVLQPTIEVAYLVSDRFRPTVALGYEWNVKTDGQETGQGAILLIGIIFNLF